MQLKSSDNFRAHHHEHIAVEHAFSDVRKPSAMSMKSKSNNSENANNTNNKNNNNNNKNNTIQLLRRLVLACVKINIYTMVTTSVVIRIVLVQVTHTHIYIYIYTYIYIYGIRSRPHSAAEGRA